MEGNRIYLSGDNAGEFLAASLVSSLFGFFSNMAQAYSRNDISNQNDERLGELLAENSRLLSEIQSSNKQKEDREREERELKIRKNENDDATFRECIEDTKTKLGQINIIRKGYDDYEMLLSNLEKNIENIWEKALENSDLNIFLKDKSKSLIQSFSFEEKEINKMNLYIMGKTGTGKTTLIKQICPSFEGKTGLGKVCTTETIEYTCKCKDKRHDFLTMIDTRGIEINKKYGAKYVKNEAERFINEKLKLGEPNDIIHCILFTIAGTRYEDIEIKVLQELRKIYKEKNIPIIIVYTQCIEDEEYINEFKGKLNQRLENEINNEPDGIRFIEILAQEKKTKKEVYKPYNLSKLIIMCYENFQYSCSIAQKRCLLTKTRDSLYKTIDDKVLTDEGGLQTENIYEKFLNYFEEILKKISPFELKTTFPNEIIMNARDSTLNYIQNLYNNFAKDQIEEISNKMLNSQTIFFSNNNNFNLGETIKSKNDWILMTKNEVNEKMFEDFQKYAFNIIWKEMEKSIKDIFVKVIKEKVLLYLEGENCKELFDEYSQCKVNLLINKLNSLIKEIHQKEEDSEIEIPEIIIDE